MTAAQLSEQGAEYKKLLEARDIEDVSDLKVFHGFNI